MTPLEEGQRTVIVSLATVIVSLAGALVVMWRSGEKRKERDLKDLEDARKDNAAMMQTIIHREHKNGKR